jgi:hypothetical protein
MSSLGALPVGRPITETVILPAGGDRGRDRDQDCESAPDGRYCLTDADGTFAVCSRIVYAFWRIQAQPLAHTAPAAPDRPARRRAARASLKHETRVVMLRRTSPITDRDDDGEPRWRYRVRFVVRGHWRRLTDRDGNRYRIGGGNAEAMAALTMRRPTRYFSSIARPDIPAARSRRIAANFSIFDIRGIGRPPSRVSRCSHPD